MQHYMVTRLGQAGLVIVGVIMIVFFMVRLSGDPTIIMLPREATAREVTELRHRMGFDRPVSVQLWDFVGRSLRGDFGTSLHWDQPVLTLIRGRLAATVELAVAGIVIALGIAVPLGIVSAIRPRSLWDEAARAIALLGQSVPTYWFGLVLILVFAVELGLLPAIGRGGWRSLILPAAAMSVGAMGRLTRLTRAAMLEVLRQDYVRTAHAKGLRPFDVYFRHALRNSAIPLLTFVGVTFGYMLGGSVIIENVFAWPGIGQLAYQAISVRDYPLVQGIAFFISAVVVALNLTVDVAYAFINPQIRYR